METQETHVLSQDEARALLSKKPKTPTFLPGILGADIIKEFDDLLNHPEIIDIDMMRLTGDLSTPDFQSYSHLAPECHQAIISAEDIAQKITEKLIARMKKNFPIMIIKSDGTGIKEPLQIRKNFQLVLDIFEPYYLDGKQAFRNQIITIASESVFAHIAWETFQFMSKCGLSYKENDPRYNAVFDEYINILKRLSTQKDASAHTTYLLWDAIGVLSHKRTEFGKFITEEKRTGLAMNYNEFNELLGEVNELSYRHSVPGFDIEKDGAKISILPERSGNSIICGIKISFANGGEETNQNTFVIDLSRWDADLYVGGTAFPLSGFKEALGGEPFVYFLRYFRAFLLEKIYEKLVEKDDATRQPHVGKQQEIVSEAVAEIVAEEIPNEEFIPQVTYRQKTTPEPALPKETNSTSEENVSHVSSDKLRNISSTRAIAALSNMLDVVRQNGSHVVFRAVPGAPGKTFPIPLHAGKSLGVGLLMRAIYMLGVDGKEFLRRV